MQFKLFGWTSKWSFLAYAIVIVVLVVLINSQFHESLHQDPAYAVATYIIYHDPSIMNAVGIVKHVKLNSGSSQGNTQRGEATYEYTAIGDRGRAHILITLQSIDGAWSRKNLEITSIDKQLEK